MSCAGLAAQTRLKTKREMKSWSLACEALLPENDIRKLLLQLDAGEVAVAAGGTRGIGRRAWLLMDTHGNEVFDDDFEVVGEWIDDKIQFNPDGAVAHMNHPDRV